MLKRRTRKRIDFDEVISDSVPSAEKLNSLEEPLNPFVFYSVFAVTLLVSVIFLGRIIVLGGVHHGDYAKRSESNINQEIVLIAPRGIITDRNDVPLVENEAIFSVFLRLDEMIRSGEEDKVLDAAERILGLYRE